MLLKNSDLRLAFEVAGRPISGLQATRSTWSEAMPAEDDHTQEWFSEDSLNLRCVLSSSIKQKRMEDPAIKIRFHNSFRFDSEYGSGGRAKEVLAELERLRRGNTQSVD